MDDKHWPTITGPIDMRPYVARLLDTAAAAKDPTLATQLRYRAWLLETGKDEREHGADDADFLVWEIAHLVRPHPRPGGDA